MLELNVFIELTLCINMLINAVKFEICRFGFYLLSEQI